MKTKFLLTFVLFSAISFSQVGVGTSLPNKSAQLDVVSNDKGLLIPKILLTSDTDSTTIANGNIDGLTVFNTSSGSGLTPGYYYWYNSKWNRMTISDDVTTQLTETQVDDYVANNDYLIVPTGGTVGQILESDGSGGFVWNTLASGGDFKADGTVPMTGNITFSGTQEFDGVDVSGLETTVDSKMAKTLADGDVLIG